MKNPVNRPQLRVTLAALCLLGFGPSLAQSLNDYQNAATALKESVAAFSTDQVQSLDALRRAETAFTPLGGALEPALRNGLQETFSRAEEAIVNQSETDLQVQAAVLQGGFGRAVYQQALRDVAGGDAGAAQNLLKVLGQDLGFENTQFKGTSQRELQGTFEARLAKRSLAQLAGFGGELGSRYRTLAQVYGYLFLVQDSPRLPPETRDTVVRTIRALITEQPTDQGVTLLKAQLTGFARSAERAGANTGAVSQATTGQNSVGQSSAGQNSAGQNTGQNSAVQTATQRPSPAAESTAPGSAADAPTTGPAAEPFVPTVPEAAITEDLASGTADASTGALPGDPVQTGAVQDSTVQDNTVQDNTVQDNTVQPGSIQNGTVQPAMVAALPFLTPELYTIFLMAAGLLALVGLVRLLFAPSVSPWRDAALALLLLPAIAEGLVALAGFLVPLTNQPLLEQAAAYSLFVNPVMQLVWTLLTAAAVLCLALSRGTAPAHREEPDPADEYKPTRTASMPDAAPQPTPATRSSPLTTGTLNWDDDF